MWRKGKPLCTVGGNVNWCSHCGKQYRVSSKKFKIELSYNPAIPHLSIYLKETKSLSKRYMHSHAHCSIIYNSQYEIIDVREQIGGCQRWGVKDGQNG